MQLILRFQTQPVLSKPSFSFFSPIFKPKTELQSTIFVPKSRNFTFPISFSRDKTQTQKPIESAKKNKRRNGSQRLTRLLLQLMPAIASNLKILPPPLDLVVEEICGGGGGGGGGGGWGMWRKGFGGGGFDGFGGKRKRKLMPLLYVLYGVLVICGLGWLIGGGDIESNVLCLGLGFGLSGVAVVQWWHKVGVFGVFLGGVLVGMGFKRDELQKLGLKIKGCYPVTWRRRRRRRSGRRAF